MSNPLKTESDYNAALAEAAVLMDAEPGTPESKRLAHLVTLIRSYEDRAWPIDDTAGA